MAENEKERSRRERAEALFVAGYNCAQSVAGAFADVCGMDMAVLLRMMSPFGGGFGRQREVCGAVSGLCAVYGLLYGYDQASGASGDAAKREVYAGIRELCAQFVEKNGFLRCRDLLGNPDSGAAPTPRTAEFYRTRPCARLVGDAAALLEAYIASHPVPSDRGAGGGPKV